MSSEDQSTKMRTATQHIILLALKNIFLALQDEKSVDAVKRELDRLNKDHGSAPQYKEIVELAFSHITQNIAKKISSEFKCLILEYLKGYSQTCKILFPFDKNYTLLSDEIQRIVIYSPCETKTNEYNRNISDAVYILCLAIINSGQRTPLFLLLKYICHMKDSNLVLLSFIGLLNTDILKNTKLSGYERIPRTCDEKSMAIKRYLLNAAASFDAFVSKLRSDFSESFSKQEESLKVRKDSLKSKLSNIKDFDIQKIISIGTETIGLTLESLMFEVSSKIEHIPHHHSVIRDVIQRQAKSTNTHDVEEHAKIANNIKQRLESEETNQANQETTQTNEENTHQVIMDSKGDTQNDPLRDTEKMIKDLDRRIESHIHAIDSNAQLKKDFSSTLAKYRKYKKC